MSDVVDLRSDTVTRPSAAMRKAMLEAELGDDVFGDDPTVNRLQERAAEIFGFEAGLFFPSGTQSNLAALISHCQRGEGVIIGAEQHSYRYEAGGLGVLGSIHPQVIPNRADGALDLAQVEATISPDDPHFPRTRLLALENTIGGKPIARAYLADAVQLARRRWTVCPRAQRRAAGERPRQRRAARRRPEGARSARGAAHQHGVRHRAGGAGRDTRRASQATQCPGAAGGAHAPRHAPGCG